MHVRAHSVNVLQSQNSILGRPCQQRHEVLIATDSSKGEEGYVEPELRGQGVDERALARACGCKRCTLVRVCYPPPLQQKSPPVRGEGSYDYSTKT